MGRILVIDDYPAVLQVMEYTLPTFGHAVVSAADGPTGLKMAATEAIDLILVDLDMPRMSGLQVCQALKQDPRLRELPVILITGRWTPEVTVKAGEVGIAAIISKPFQWNELIETISRFLALPGRF